MQAGDLEAFFTAQSSVLTSHGRIDTVLSEPPPTEVEEPFVPPPELLAEIEDKMLRQWINESIPALGGQTPREAVKVLELIEYSVQTQKRRPKRPGIFAPDHRKVKKMLGEMLEGEDDGPDQLAFGESVDTVKVNLLAHLWRSGPTSSWRRRAPRAPMIWWASGQSLRWSLHVIKTPKLPKSSSKSC
ncbi:MAG TPA: hypothetical protein ENN19_10230 [Chloroflexi bacterium]|nr:hypothetical protein [Chloroflexota bacterium]